jgi:hypothetical protein
VNKTFFDENTSPQELESTINQYIDTPKDSHPEDLSEKVYEAAAHPQMPAAHLSKLYLHNMAKPENTPENIGSHESIDSDLTEKILQNLNTPKDIHEQHLAATHSSNSEHHNYAISNPAVSNDVIQSFLENRAKSESAWNMPAEENVHPDVGFNLFNKGRELKDIDPKHSEALKEYGLDILQNSKKHTDETLKRVVDAYHKGQPLNSGFLGNLISKNKNLTKDQLNQIHNKHTSSEEFDPDYGSSVISSIAEHPNTDPSLLSLIANDKKYKNHASDALKNPALPMEVFNNKISKLPKRGNEHYDHNDEITESLLQNPNITKDQVSELFKKGFKSALNHEKTDESLIENHWNSSDKSADAANKILRTKNLPESVLKELVNHKNQDVAIEALNHKNATENVVNEGLKRKAKAVQEEAAKHPLVKDRAITEKLKNKSVNASTIASDNDYKEKFDKLSDLDKSNLINHFHEKLSGSDIDAIAKNSKEKKSDVLLAKRFLARDKSVPQHIKDHHSDEFFDMFTKEFGTNSDINVDRDDLHKRQLFQTARDLLSDENPTAQKRLLEHTPLMSALGPDVASKSKNPDFIKKLVKRAKDADGESIIDRWGHPRPYNSSDLRLSVLKNPNLSLEDLKGHLSDPSFNDFDKYALNNIMDKTKGSPEKQAETLSFLKNLNRPEVNKHLLLGSFLTGNDQESAFENLESKYDKSEFLKENADKISPSLADRILSGEFNDNYTQMKHNLFSGLENPPKEIEDKVLNHLDELSKGPVADLTDSLNSISNSFKKSERWKNNAKELSASNPTLASQMYSHHIDVLPAEKQKDAISNLEAYEDSLGVSPEQKDMRKKAFWKAQLLNINRLGRVFEKGELDHLADLQSTDEDETALSIKSLLLNKRLLSDNKASEIVAKDPSLFEDYYNSLHKIDDKIKSIDSVINNPNSDKNLLFKAVGKINPTHLSEYKIDKDNQNEVAKKLANKIADLSKLQDQKHLQTAVQGLTRPIKGHLTEGVSESLIKKAADEILKNDKIPQDKKVRMLSAVSSAMDVKGVTHQATSKFLTKAVSESEDVNTLLPAIQSSTFDFATKTSMAKKANEMLSNPEAIAKVDTQKLLDFTTNANCTAEVKTLVANKATEELFQEQDLDKQVEKAEKLASALNYSSNDSSFNSDARIYHLAEHPNPEVRMVAYKQMRSTLSSNGIESNIELYKNMPDDIKLHPIDIDQNEANNADFVEASTKGWKLDTLIVNGGVLNKENSKVMINRAIESEDPAHKRLALQSLMSSVYTDKNDLTKLARASSEEDLLKSLSIVQNPFQLNAHFALSELMDKVDQKMENPEMVIHGAKFLDKEHTKNVLSILSDIASNIGKTIFDEGTYDINAKNEVYEEVINKHTDHSNTILNNLKNQILEEPSETKVKVNSLINNLRNIVANSGLKFSKETHNKLMESYNLHKDLYEKLGTRFNTPVLLGGIIEKTEGLNSEDWKSLFEKTPESKYFIGHRSSIGTDISDHLSFSKEDQNWSHSPVAVQFALDKLDSQSLDKHGKRLFTEALNATNGSPNQKYVIETGLSKMGDRLNHKDLLDIRKALPEFSQHFDTVAIKSGAGGKELLADSVKKVEELAKNKEQSSVELLSAICRSRHLDENLANKMLEIHDNHPEVMEELANNNSVHPNVLLKIQNEAAKLSPRTSKKIVDAVISNSNTPFDVVKKAFETTQKEYKPYFMSNTSFNPALDNSKWGPSLLREMPVVLPEGLQNVDGNSLKQKTSEFSTEYSNKRKKALNVMAAIPDTGINWVEFKRQNPSLEAGLPKEVKDIFTRNANTPITKENMVSLVKSMDSEQKKREYHLAYSSWSGVQTHTGGKNLVMTLNLSQQTEEELKKDPKVFALYKKVTQIANGISGKSIGAHPTTPYAVSWSRVDTDQNGEAWVIEELQADAVQKFRSNFRRILNNMASGSNIDGHSITSEEMKSMVKTIEKTFDGWDRATINAVIENAKAHGIKKLYMHGLGIRSCMSGGEIGGPKYTKDYINPNIKRLYDQLPQEYGFSKCKYSDYPKNNAKRFNDDLKSRELNDDCWVLDLEEKPKA